MCRLSEEVERLDTDISKSVERILVDGEHKLTVATVRDSDRMCVRIGGAEIAFPCHTASLTIIVRNLLGSGPVAK